MTQAEVEGNIPLALQASMEELLAAKMAAQALGNRVQLIWPQERQFK